MSWTALLESFHSSLIDELVELHPEPKPELGMPSRSGAWTLPSPSASPILVCEVRIGDSRGYALLALEPECTDVLRTDAQGLWNAVLKRVDREFIHRGISPVLATPLVMALEKLPGDLLAVTRLIWIPIRLNGAGCFLGLAV